MSDIGTFDGAMPATTLDLGASFTGTILIPLRTDPLSLNRRLHWRTVAKLTKQWRQFTEWKAKRWPALGRCDATLTWFVVDNRRRDEDNLFRLMKALCDGLVDAGVVIDDTHEYMRKRCRIKPAEPGTQLAYMELRVERRS